MCVVWDAGIQRYISNQVKVQVYFKCQLCLPPILTLVTQQKRKEKEMLP